MTFVEKIADYVLGSRTPSQFPDIGLSGISEYPESESLLILAGMNYRDNSFELIEYFNQALHEIKMKLPSKLEAANTLISYYLNKLILNPENGILLMTKIQDEIYYANDWSYLNSTVKKQYVGEELGLQHLFTWFREIQDFIDGSQLMYYNNLTPTQQKLNIENNLINEAKNWLKLNCKNS